jgi:hypothetical protein
MQNTQVPGGLNPFTPHPGKIIHHYKWNGKDEVVDATSVPDEVKFIYYDKSGNEATDTSVAAYRVPIVEVDIVSLNKEGKLIEPSHAVHFFMTDYGPGHRELRHTTAAAPGN